MQLNVRQRAALYCEGQQPVKIELIEITHYFIPSLQTTYAQEINNLVQAPTPYLSELLSNCRPDDNWLLWLNSCVIFKDLFDVGVFSPIGASWSILRLYLTQPTVKPIRKRSTLP